MAVSPTPGQLEYVSDNATERRAKRSSVLELLGEFYLYEWIGLLSLVIVLVGLAGNSAVLWLLSFRTRRNPFSIYILNLARADTLFLCCYFLMLIAEFVIRLHFYLLYAVLNYLANAFYSVGVSLLAAISTGHCLAVLYPSWYLHDHPKNTSAAVCAVLWVLPGLLCVGQCIYVKGQLFRGTFCSLRAAWLIHFTPVLCVSSLTLLLRVQCSSQRQQRPRLYLLVLLMVLVFLLCGLPRRIQDAISGFSLPFVSYHSCLTFHWLFKLLDCLKSSVYPFIYFVLGSRRHRRCTEPLSAVLQRVLADEQELDGDRRDSRLTDAQETAFE
ncbi:mas-related G-protein coupled receptor member X1-like [Petaurus breviceps papuanus]|uniref:mas-related G-protein coupled receptor member X1-like n=1 Tax=Petaurus breviceps papuanus TaxID=3040969 RepID=UPI0036DEA826